jgi:hypothetical protein
MTREPVHRKNARAILALGIVSIEFEKQKGMLAIWRVALISGESFTVETPGLGTESTVIRIAAEKLKDRPVRYVA